jgi:TolA-binding protein
MFRNNLRHWYATLSAALIVASVVNVAMANEAKDAKEKAAASAKTAGGKAKSLSLSDIGLALDAAKLQPAETRRGPLESVERDLTALVDKGIDKKQKSVALFLSGEIRYALGDYARAVEVFEDAAKEGKKGPFADDAAAAAIQALEAAENDEEAAKAWIKWRKKYKDSPLVPEVMVAQAWNSLRRDNLEEASALLEELANFYPWSQGDPRVALAQSTIALREGRYSDVTVKPTGASTDAAAIYLRALAEEASGNMLKAAAKYQEVAERYPHSGLRDHAMLGKANIFLSSAAYKSAVEEFARVAEATTDKKIKAEAKFRQAASEFLDGNAEAGTTQLRGVAKNFHGTDVAARAQLLLGEVLMKQGRYEEAVVEFNAVLEHYFQHELAASAQYRVARCFDALNRGKEATSTYQTVVSGYPMSAEAPAAAYLAGAGLLAQDRAQTAIPYFQLVLDRYAIDAAGTYEFESPERQELVEAALCLLQYSYHQVGDLGQLSGVPHMMLQKMPPSNSMWRAYALLIDADGLAAQARYAEAQAVLDELIREFPDEGLGVPAYRLLAWTYTQEGKEDLAIATEEKMLARFGAATDAYSLSSAYLNKAHILFNKKNYDQAVAAYEDFLYRFPEHPEELLALYQAGMCYVRLDRDGDAIDRWDTLLAADPSAAIAEQAWFRTGDVYFQAGHMEEAKVSYQGLIDNFQDSPVAAVGQLRIAQCDYNAGRDADAIAAFSLVVDRYPHHEVVAEAQRGIEQALYRLGTGDDGAERLAELVERFPTSTFAADAQFNIGMQRYEAKEYADAAEEFRRVITQFPGYSAADQAHYLMGDAYMQAGNATDAALAYEQFVIFFPESELRSTVRFRLASIRFADGDYMRAAVDFTAVVDDSTSGEMTAAALYNLALAHRMMGDQAQAQILLEEYRTKYPNDERAAEVAHQLGDIHDTAGRPETAAAEFERALTAEHVATLSVELYYRLGVCREDLGDTDAALAAYKKAMRTKDKSDAFRLSAVARSAAIYETEGKYKDALRAYRDLIKHATDPDIVVAAQERAAELEATGE